MAPFGLTPGHQFLREAAKSCFEDRYGRPTMHVDKPLSPGLAWVPALRFTVLSRINVFVEPSDSGPYPRILKMKHVEVSNFPEPIAVYSVCADGAVSAPGGLQEMRRLQSHGFGLVTVDPSGTATVVFQAIPLVQSIPEAQVKSQLKGLPQRIKQRASEAFVEYRDSPVNGVKTLSELIEGMVMKAGQDAAKRGRQIPSQVSVARILDALHMEFPNARAAIGGARRFVNDCRNVSHHWPRNKRDSYRKFVECKQHFLEGVRLVSSFRGAMKNENLSGNVPRI